MTFIFDFRSWHSPCHLARQVVKNELKKRHQIKKL
jgi:hypothetical protein